MEIIHKLPFILGATMAILVGILCNLTGVRQQDTYLRMAIFMAVFFIIGTYIRKTITKILEEIDAKKQEEEARLQAEMEEAERVEEERLKEAGGQKHHVGSKVDLKVEDDGEEFSPYTVSDYIESESKGKY